jgi:hypothetical protein
MRFEQQQLAPFADLQIKKLDRCLQELQPKYLAEDHLSFFVIFIHVRLVQISRLIKPIYCRACNGRARNS